MSAGSIRERETFRVLVEMEGWTCARCGKPVNRRSDGKGWEHSRGYAWRGRPDHAAQPVRQVPS